jgi:RNA polymerase sigma-32 factor
LAGEAMERKTPLSTTMVRAAARHPMLGNEEERRLARHSAAGDSAAAGQLIASHLRFVIKIARTYRNSGLPMSDLIQEGTVGLIQAVRRFNPDRGVRLSTYAMWWIRAAIQDYVVRSWSLVRIGTTNTQKAVFLRLRQIRAELISGAEDLSDEIIGKLAARLGTTATEVAAVARRMTSGDQSLDQPLSGNADEAGPTLLDHMTSDAPTPEETVAANSEHSFISKTIGKALAMLPPREQFIIRKRYFEEARQTFEAIGHEIGLSKDRVRQLEARALEKLRDLLRPALAEQR